MSKKTKTIVWLVLGIALVVILGVLLMNVINAGQELTYDTFYGKVCSGEINELYLDAYNWTGKVVDANGKVTATYTTVAPSIYDYISFQSFVGQMNPEVASKLTVTFADPNAGSIWSSLFPFVGVLFVGVIFFLIMPYAVLKVY